MKRRPPRLKLVGCIPLDDENVGFAVPVFMHPTDPKLFVIQEIDELSGRVFRFRTLEHPASQVIHVAGASVGIGEEQLYAFLSGSKDVSVGNLAALRPALEQFAKTDLASGAVVLQIKELIGSDKEKKIARTRMRGLLLKTQGDAAARTFYEGSVLRSVLWNRLMSAATSEEMAKRILEARGRLSASINHNGHIVLNLSALSQEDQAAINRVKLVSAMLLEFEPQPGTIDEWTSAAEPEVHDAGQVQRKVEDLLDRVQRTGRQEERIALLMAAILNDPTIGKTALLQYRTDRAKMASWGIGELRKAFIDTKWSSDEHVISALIPQLFTKNWPMTRGDLLFFLAKHLGRFPHVNAAIREVLQRTHSIYVDWSRKEIENALSADQTMSSTQGMARGAHDALPDATGGSERQ